MKNKYLKLFIFLSVAFSIASCGLLNKAQHNCNEGNTETALGASQVMTQVINHYSKCQIDSMCVADMLPSKFNGWIKRTYTDYETKTNVTRYMFIKELNEYNEMIYIVTPKGEMFIVAKRKVIVE